MTEPNQTSVETPPPAVPSPAKAAGRAIRIALAVSVALNLAVAGLMAGIVLHGGPVGHGEMMVRHLGFGPFDAALLPEDRDALRKAVRERFGDIRAARQQMQSDVQAVLSAMKAEPFDPAALSAALRDQTDHMGERLEFGSEMIGNYILSMSGEARRAFADRLEDRLQRGRGGDQGKGAD